MSLCARASPHPDAAVGCDRMVRALTHASLRSIRRWQGAGAALAVTNGATVATDPGGRLAALDGVLHDRDGLAGALGLTPSTGDATLALAAFSRWGDDFADRLVGDFACAIWDAGERRMLLATDPSGLRPLFWGLVDGELRAASDYPGMWAEGDLPRVLDGERVADWLVLAPTAPGRTFYRDVHRVTGGTVAIWRDGRIETRRWWRPERLAMLRLANGEYPALVRETLEQAVACRLGTHEHIGSHLSGGLDSGGVTAIAARQLAGQHRRLTAFTAAPARPVADPRGRFADEWPHAARVAARYPNIDHVRIANDAVALDEAIEASVIGGDMPVLNPSNLAWAQAIERDARGRGIAVLLTAQWGNMSFSYDGHLLPRMQWRRGRIDRAVGTLWAMRRALGWRWRTLLGALADTALPAPTAGRLRALIGRGGLALEDYSAIHPAFLAASGRAGEYRRYAGNLANLHPDDSRARRLAMLARGDVRGDYAAATRRRYGIDMRDPTLDRRLVELCLTIPEEQYCRGGVPRSLARDTLVGILPEAVRGELRRGLQAADWAFGFDAAVPAFRAELARLRASRGAARWLDLDRLEGLLDRWPGPTRAQTRRAGLDYQLAFSRALATGRFVRAIEGGNA